MRRPVQCDGIERGPERALQIGTVAAVQPQFLGAALGALGSYLVPKIPDIVRALT